MQPNFAFETTSALEIIPQSRPAEHLSSNRPSRQKSSCEPSAADRSHQSFRSSLREASRRQEDTSRSKPVDDEYDGVQRQDRESGHEKVASSKTQADTDGQSDAAPANSAESAEESTSDLATPDISEPGDNAEIVDNELAGIGAVTLTAPLTETVDSGLSFNPDSGTSNAAATGSGAQPTASPGDMLAGGSGADNPDPTGGLLGQNDGANKADPDARANIPATEMAASAKIETLTPLKSDNGTEQATADLTKGFDEWVKTEKDMASTDQSKAADRQDFGAASSVKNDASDRLVDPLQRLHQVQAEQSVSGQKHPTAKAVPIEDATVARASEVSSEQQSSGRMQNDLLQGRESEAKNESVAADEAAPKIAKMNPGGRDSAFMQHQDQNFERLMEPAPSTREKESSPGLLRTQTIDQIVNKAVYQLRNGQNSVRIDLKPEFLGQVRMQIVTVDQQVSIRIAAELPVVKEMLENNLQQLKADLQQQGLEVDEIEVSVSTDSQHNAQNQKMKSDLMSQFKTSADEDAEEGAIPAPETTPRVRTSNLAVDMFV